jgi:hypothetical protein
LKKDSPQNPDEQSFYLDTIGYNLGLDSSYKAFNECVTKLSRRKNCEQDLKKTEEQLPNRSEQRPGWELERFTPKLVSCNRNPALGKPQPFYRKYFYELY